MSTSVVNKINSLAIGSVAKVNSLVKASMAKINSLVNTLFGDSYSIVLDGTNDHVTAHGAATSPFNGNLGSISLWFKLNTVSATKHLFCITQGNSLGNNFIRVFYHASGNNLRLQHKGNGTTKTITASGTVENNGWHHLAFTWSAAGETAISYIDGAAAGNAEGLVAMSFEEGSLDTLHIGTKDGSTGPWDGNINDFAIYSDVLTAGEVTTIYNGGGANDLTSLGSSGNLIEYWTMENSANGGGSEANAITLVNGASYDSGDVPVAFDTYSILFDGTDDHMTADGAAGQVAAAGSVSMWAKLETYAYTESMFAAKIDSNNYLWLFYHGGTNQTRFEIKGEGSGDTVEETLIATTAVENNGWHHFAFTWDTGGDTSALYIDGSSVDTGTATPLVGEQSGIDFGKRRGHAWEQFEGNMNDIAIFDDVLTSGEVSTIYNSGKPKDESSHSGLVGYWKMEENTGTSVADSSSNSNAITLVNGAAWSTDIP